VADRFEHDAPRLDRNTILSYDRTRLSYQRTMLAWVRTGTSLIGFGVAIYNFHRMTGGQLGSYLIGPHEFALAMIGTGLVTLLLATIEYRRDIRLLSAHFADIPRSPLPALVALLVSILGIMGLILIIFRK